MARATTGPPAKMVMDVRSAEGALVTAIAAGRSNQLRSRTSASGTSRHIALPHAPARYRGNADVALVASSASFIGTRPNRIKSAEILSCVFPQP